MNSDGLSATQTLVPQPIRALSLQRQIAEVHALLESINETPGLRDRYAVIEYAQDRLDHFQTRLARQIVVQMAARIAVCCQALVSTLFYAKSSTGSKSRCECSSDASSSERKCSA